MRTIDGALYVASEKITTGKTARITEKWNGDTLAEIVLADAATAERATEASVVAFEKFRAVSNYTRKSLLFAIARGIENDSETLSVQLAKECGKPITQARGEIARAVSTFEIASEEATRIGGEIMPLDITKPAEGYRGEWFRVPAGPVIGISPFNFPMNLVAHKVAPALACGASIVLKPPPQCPLSSLALAAIVRDAAKSVDAPENILQVVPCENSIAEKLVTDDRFKLLSFTGSDKVGWHLKSVAGKKKVLLELGGNAAAIVHDDADFDFAFERIFGGAFGYAGQVCIKVQRVYVQRTIVHKFIEKMAAKAREAKPADPMDEKGVLSCVIDEANAKRIETWVNEAIQAGAKLLAGGTREGARVMPTVLSIDGQGKGMKVVDDEVFGPVVTVHSYDTWDQALDMASDTRFGLQAGVFTDSHARIRQAIARIDAGGIIVNDVPTFRVDNMPYGGVRDSGLGREGVRFAIEEMCETKLVVYRDKPSNAQASRTPRK
jgi:acyl-CoA reductase-like NAD-dependent aldehyde dehydrogenase